MRDQAMGPNGWLVDEMRAAWLDDPNSVTDSWKAYFSSGLLSKSDVLFTTSSPIFDSTSGTNGTNGSNVANDSASSTPTSTPTSAMTSTVTSTPTSTATLDSHITATPVPAPVPAATAPVAPVVAATPAPQPGGALAPEPLRGVPARIVANMNLSLTVPTATSVRDVPAKLLEVERNIMNRFLARSRGGKVSFTHLIAYAVVKALDAVPAMRNTFVADADGNPMINRNPYVNLGIAVDVPKPDGTRSLVVPAIKRANEMNFREFHDAYEALIAKARINKLTVDDMTGVTVSITNPGGLGTRHSVPRLMPGQAAIIGLGTIDFPAAFSSADPAKLAEIGISKVVTLTSTYDHRIIQGAESGLFLDRVQALLEGRGEGAEFYDDVFAAMGVAYEPARWNRDSNATSSERNVAEKAAAIQEIINAYRSRGHLISDLDPLDAKAPTMPAELDPLTWELSIWDLDRTFYTGMIAGADEHTLGELLGILRDAYCRTTGVEYMHIMDPVQKKWIQSKVEGVNTNLTKEEQRHVLSRLNAAEAFEKFLHKRYVGQKRFGLEGGESAMVIIDAILDGAAAAGLQEVVIGMPHRGRLNTLVNVVGKSVSTLFREFEDMPTSSVQGSGDVKYHLGAEGSYVGLSKVSIPVSLTPNPSHLETVAPVVEGIVRAKLDATNVVNCTAVLPFLMHGDAAFAGQGVVPETLQLSQLAGYRTGGSIHLVVNNQVGFTTNPDSARSSIYCTDVAKTIQAPIFHVNGDDPEACFRVGRLAFEYRQAFERDAIIDMVCYRKHGHNEGDEPRYTQPLMYERIDERSSVRELYTNNLAGRKDITMEEAAAAVAEFESHMQRALDETRAEKQSGNMRHDDVPHGEGLPESFEVANTAVARDVLDRVAAATHSWPAGFTPHPKLAKQLETRGATYASTGEVDWALAEAMAYGSMALEGHVVRISGEDSRRGTFSHRQAVLIDVETGAEHYPLATMSPDQGRFVIYDSSLSEYAVLGFDYGYTIANKNAFVAWEAQFGDFVNGAQIVIDQYLVSGESKWGQTSNLTLLLPHGYEGQGPEHSSARLERFLQQCADDNIRVANVTSAAQIFHLLRRQMKSTQRKPLILMAPKSGLRAKQNRSNVSELVSGTFHEVLDDNTGAITDRNAVRRVVLCSGKVVWDAIAARDAAVLGSSIAIVRVEQLYPWPEAQISELLASYPNATEVQWMQEESANMGGWSFVQPRMWAILGAFPGRTLGLNSRPASGSPAVGGHHAHDLEVENLKHGVIAGL
jgi:multifunctional 2-oxoglutarate metabolism enzyme